MVAQIAPHFDSYDIPHFGMDNPIALAALIVSGTILLFSPMGGWHHFLGVSMIIIGIIGILIGRISAWIRKRGETYMK